MGDSILNEGFLDRIKQFYDEFSFESINTTLINTFKTFPINFENILKTALNETLYMSFMATFLGFCLAIIPAILLTLYDKNGLKENIVFYRILDFFINTLRAFPFLILIIVLLPLSKIIIGTSIGTSAAIVPLSIGIAPYLTKMLESAFKEVDKSTIEAAKSYGATNLQIIFKIIFVESLPNIINSIVLTLIFTIGFSALAGTIGGGGLGDIAIRYGYERFNTEIMLQTIIILLVLVQAVQIIGNLLYKLSKK